MIILCGKTCSGKNFIRDLLIEEGLKPVVTYTTRPMRKGEVADQTYHYLSNEDFIAKAKAGFFVESVAYNSASGDTWYYGSHFSKEDDNKVIILNPGGVEALLNAKNLEVKPVVFYLEVPEPILRERASLRGDQSKETIKRLETDNKDFKDFHQKADVVLQNTGEVTPKELVQTILDFHNRSLQGISPWKACENNKEKEMKRSCMNMDRE